MSNNDESETPIEDKQNPPPKGNIITDIIKAVVFVTLAAYGSSSFLYMLHISSEEKRKMKEADDKLAKGGDFSVLSGSYIYGPPYFPNEKNVINFNPNDLKSKRSMKNPKNFNDPQNTILKVKEQNKSINLSYADNVNINKYINKQWNRNCPKKYNELGENLRNNAKYSYNSHADSLHDWLYASTNVCNAQNLKAGVYDSKNTWNNVTKSIARDGFNVLVSLVGLDEKNEENLNPGQVEYRKKLSYNIYRYIFFIVVGTLAFSRNILNKILKVISFDNNEFEYWDKEAKGLKSPFSRKPFTKEAKEDYDRISSHNRYIKGLQSLLVLIFAGFNRSIFPLIMTSGLFIGGFASIVFALYKWNFTTMLTWWSASTDKGPFLWFIFSIVSLLFWILAIYLMLIIPGFIGYINSFVVVAIFIATLFIYPFYDDTPVYVKTLVRSSQYVDNNYSKYGNSGGNKPVESQQKSNYDTKINKCVNVPLPGRNAVVLDNVQVGNNEYVFISKNDDGSDNPKEIHKLQDNKCYEKYIQKKSGFAYIQHLVGKNKKFWMSLLLHDIVRFIDADTTVHKIAGQNITLVGDPSSNMSINFGTIPLLYFGLLKVSNVFNYLRGVD